MPRKKAELIEITEILDQTSSAETVETTTAVEPITAEVEKVEKKETKPKKKTSKPKLDCDINNFHIGVSDEGIFIGMINPETSEWELVRENTEEIISGVKDYFSILSSEKDNKEYESSWGGPDHPHLLYYEGDSSYSDKLKNTNARNELLMSEREFFSNQAVEKQNENENLKIQIESLNSQIDELNQRVVERENRVNDLENQFANNVNENNNISQDNERLSAENNSLRMQIESIQNEIKEIKDRNNELINKLTEDLNEEKDIKNWYANILYKYTSTYKILKETVNKLEFPFMEQESNNTTETKETNENK